MDREKRNKQRFIRRGVILVGNGFPRRNQKKLKTKTLLKKPLNLFLNLKN